MKQHITVSDLDQLTPAGKKRLIKAFKLEHGDYYVAKVQGSWEIFLHGGLNGISQMIADKPFMPLPSIGRLIEFLDEQKWHRCFEISHAVDIWLVADAYYGVTHGDREWVSKELCDALFSAVKDILNKD